MRATLRSVVGACALAAASASVFAQATVPAAASAPLTAEQREAIQDRRIEKGLAAGTISPQEAKRLQREQRMIDRKQAKYAADGTMTKREQRRLDMMQDGASSDIHNQRHDVNGVPTTHTPLTVDQRQTKQDQRIDKGVASGELTSKEANRLNREQAYIDNRESKFGADGQVTQREQKKLKTMQSMASADIKRQKHDKKDANK